MTDWMNELGEKAHRAAGILNTLDTNTKNQVLLDAANRLIASTDRILAANAKDLEAARENNMAPPAAGSSDAFGSTH